MNVINSFSVGKDFIEIFVDKATSGGSCTVLTTTVQPGGGPPLHQHSREDETFRVLEGQFDFLVDGVTHTVKTGEIFFVDVSEKQWHYIVKKTYDDREKKDITVLRANGR